LINNDSYSYLYFKPTCDMVICTSPGAH